VADFLSTILAKQRENADGGGSCFDARALIEAGNGYLRDERTLPHLASHLLNCGQCSARWEEVQSDHHVELAGLHVLRMLSGHHFVKLLALNHVSRCQTCQRSSEELDRLVIAEDLRSVHLANLATRIRQMTCKTTAVRSQSNDTLSAVVLDAQGNPVVVRNRIKHWKVQLRKADLENKGRLTLEFKLPHECLSVQAAVRSCGVPVLLPPRSPEKNLAAFVIETRIPGDYRRLPASSIALWITQ
jgi:hypothetical protein